MAKERKNQKTKLGAGITAIAAVIYAILSLYSYITTGSFLPTSDTPDGEPTIRFVDVGQGDCVLITYEGDVVLIDAGPASSGDETAEYIHSYAPVVDYFIITHPHEDHMGGAADVLSSVEVKNVMMPDYQAKTAFYKKTMDIIEEKGINVIIPDPDMVFATDNITITVLDSEVKGETDPNNLSLVTRIDAGSTSIMSVGDAEAEAELVLLENYADDDILDCDILKVGHHGSSTSTTAEFLYAVSPAECVISCGEGNSYGHPHRETVELLESYDTVIYRTDLSGTVVLHGEK